MKADRGVEQDVDLGADDLRELVGTFKGIYEERKGEPFPQEPRAQLDAAVRAVFESWDNRRARDYRRLNRIPHDLGTAVNVQQMVFGNTGPRSGTGVAFTRSNVTGETSRALRRLPHQRPGRGRRRGHPHAAPAGRAGRRAARGLRPADRDHGAARAHLPQHAGRRVHHRGRRPLHAADAQRQAQRPGDGAHRRRHGRTRASSPSRSRSRRWSTRTRSTSSCCPSSTSRPRRRRWRAASTPRPGPPRGRSSSRPTRPRRAGKAGEHVILVRDETTRTTSTAWSRRRAS